MPTFRIIIPTKDRAGAVVRAAASALDQGEIDHEVVVVDDGGTDDTPSRLQPLLRADPRLSYVRQESGGVGAARNRGASGAAGDVWLTFLDSDDEALSGWLATFAEAITAAVGSGTEHGDLAIVFSGAEAEERGRVERLQPHDLGPLFDHIEGLFLAGTFAIRTWCFRELGGYTEGLPYSENTDLGLRLADMARDRGWRTAAVDRAGVSIRWAEVRHPPEVRLLAAEAMLRAHGARFAGDPHTAAAYRSMAGVAAARLGRHREARRWFLDAFRVQPWSGRNLARVVMSVSPTLLRRRYRPD